MDRYIPKLSPAAWQWVRFAGLLAAIALLLWILYILAPVFTPLLLAFVIAYILNPVVTWLDRRHRVSRLTTTLVVFAIAAALLIGGGIYATTVAIGQLVTLQARIPVYVERVGQFLSDLELLPVTPIIEPTTLPADAVAVADPEIEPDAAAVAATQPTTQPAGTMQWWHAARPYVQEYGTTIAGATIRAAHTVFGNVITLATLLILVPMFAFYFLWRFNDLLRVVHDHLPAASRPTIVHVVRTSDEAVANFFRGRLVVSLIVGALTAIGWTIVGVPYSVPLGLLAGVFNLVPFLSLLALPLALLSAYVGAVDAGNAWMLPLILTMGVYIVVQALESFALSPAIEGQASGLHPLVIVVALLIGAQLAGLLGLLLAIPVTSTLKVLASQYVLPEVRRLAGIKETAPAEDVYVLASHERPEDAPAETPGNAPGNS